MKHVCDQLNCINNKFKEENKNILEDIAKYDDLEVAKEIEYKVESQVYNEIQDNWFYVIPTFDTECDSFNMENHKINFCPQCGEDLSKSKGE